ncbi:hypothetical protein DBV05_g7023 [Lasiodiplodia theobromae]|uniref:Uncharacterized protein n=1 Tax=Lasiodiplodia theobromae TaxID=45133 RepID=A0A5N5DAL3_9PEZI|nr:hypothetical protein DBV05_g7023 [Lasiodiplodia theobromae]
MWTQKPNTVDIIALHRLQCAGDRRRAGDDGGPGRDDVEARSDDAVVDAIQRHFPARHDVAEAHVVVTMRQAPQSQRSGGPEYGRRRHAAELRDALHALRGFGGGAAAEPADRAHRWRTPLERAGLALGEGCVPLPTRHALLGARRDDDGDGVDVAQEHRQRVLVELFGYI